jgi:hypothetical protein
MIQIEWMIELFKTVEPEEIATADAGKMSQLLRHRGAATEAEMKKRLLVIQRERGKSKAEMLPVWGALNLDYPEQG